MCENPRKDLIWRFIVIISLALSGLADFLQDVQEIFYEKTKLIEKDKAFLENLRNLMESKEQLICYFPIIA